MIRFTMTAVMLASFACLADLAEFTESGPGSVGTMRTKLNATIRQTNTNTSDLVSLKAGTNLWNAAVTNEADPFWNAQSGAVYSAIASAPGTTNAAGIHVADAGGYYASNTLEGVAQEIGAGSIPSDDWVETKARAADAYAWGDHNAQGYLTGYTETDPVWNAQSGAVYSAIGLKLDAADSNNFASAAQGSLAESAVQDSNAATDLVQINADTSFQISSPYVLIDGDLNGNGYLAIDENPTTDLQVGNRGYNDGRYVQPTVDPGALTLDTQITAWEDIGLTYSNAVRLNSSIAVTNNSTWTGWTTDGDLSGTNIVLESGEYLLSPVQSNGIAAYTVESAGTVIESVSAKVGTNTVAIPYYGDDARLRIDAAGGMPVPGETHNLVVSRAVIVGVENVAEAQLPKTVTRIDLIEDQPYAYSAAKRSYVDEAEADARDYADGILDDYAADPDKTVRGAELRLGNMWVVSPADTSGDRFIVSGGEITGGGELVGTTNEFVISKNDYPLLEFTSEASGVFITNFTVSATSSNATFTIYIATNGVASAPFAEWSETLVGAEWSRMQTYATETYPTASAGTYTLEFTVPSGDTAYVRAMQAEGDSVAMVKTDVFDFNGSRLLMTDLVNSNSYRIAVSNGVVIAIAE